VKSKMIAVCGKGGVGKTSVSALMIRQLAKLNGKKILAIDADPAVGLSTALDMPVRKTVDDIRKDIISSSRTGKPKQGKDTLAQLDYELFEALEQKGNIALLAIGRPEDEGCFCKVNNLLKDIIADIAQKFDFVIIDGEAGVEQINRRVMKKVDHLILVSDTSAKAVNVANTISHVATDNRAVDFKSMGLVLNRVRDPEYVEDIRKRTAIKLYGWISEDDLIRDYDFRGKALTSMPDEASTLNVISSMLGKMKLLS